MRKHQRLGWVIRQEVSSVPLNLRRASFISRRSGLVSAAATAATLLGAIVELGMGEGLIRVEVRFTDIVFVIRFSRPVAIGLSLSDERAIAHRHLDIYIDGLGSGDHARTPLAELPTLD